MIYLLYPLDKLRCKFTYRILFQQIINLKKLHYFYILRIILNVLYLQSETYDLYRLPHMIKDSQKNAGFVRIDRFQFFIITIVRFSSNVRALLSLNNLLFAADFMLVTCCGFVCNKFEISFEVHPILTNIHTCCSFMFR